MFQWMKDRNRVKDVFDVYRNYLICGAIMYATRFTVDLAKSSYGHNFDFAIFSLAATILFIMFWVMIFANSSFALNVIFPNHENETNWRRKAVGVGITIAFLIVAAPIAMSAAG